MIRLLTAALLVFSVQTSFASDVGSMRQDAYKLRSECRVGDGLTNEQSENACAELAKVEARLVNLHQCWDDGEQVWSDCKK